MEIDLRQRNVKPGRAQEISDPLGALHRLFQTAGKQLNVFLVGFERKFALGEMFRQRFVVIIDQVDQRAPQFHPHLWIDDDLERRRGGIGFRQSPARGHGLLRRHNSEIVFFCHADLLAERGALGARNFFWILGL